MKRNTYGEGVNPGCSGANLLEKVKSFPLSPGVYIMKSDQGTVLYVGKAVSLKKRVRSYFSSNNSLKTSALLENVYDIEFIECHSQAQALILEAALIKEKKPKYNVALRDDKSYPFIEITREQFPRVFLSRPKEKNTHILFGPYAHVGLVKSALKLIRKIFPYRSCVCLPRHACLFYHLNLCPAPCVGKISAQHYEENIKNICYVLSGRRKELIEMLEQKMQVLAANQQFEEASALRDKLVALSNLYGGAEVGHELIALRDVLSLKNIPLVIEAIDISCLGGKVAYGSVVVLRGGKPDNTSYRSYRIKEVEKTDDYAMIGEVVRRRYSRLKNEEKSLPDLIVIDGGKGHVERAKQELDAISVFIPVIGIAKQNEEIWFPGSVHPVRISKENPGLHVIQRIRDEAHRFARKYHVRRRQKEMFL